MFRANGKGSLHKGVWPRDEIKYFVCWSPPPACAAENNEVHLGGGGPPCTSNSGSAVANRSGGMGDGPGGKGGARDGSAASPSIDNANAPLPKWHGPQVCKEQQTKRTRDRSGGPRAPTPPRRRGTGKQTWQGGQRWSRLPQTHCWRFVGGGPRRRDGTSFRRSSGAQSPLFKQTGQIHDFGRCAISLIQKDGENSYHRWLCANLPYNFEASMQATFAFFREVQSKDRPSL